MEPMTDYDVIVAGGGAAGTSAAVASARSGAKTLLLERHGCLGGAASVRNVLTFCGLYTLGDPPRRAVGGIAMEVIDALKKLDAVTPPLRFRGVFSAFDPEALKFVLDELAGQAGVAVRFGSFVAGAEREGDRITGISVADHSGVSKLRAKAFIDCTGDGDLAAHGGASTRYGNEGSANLGTLGTRFGGVSPDVTVTAQDISAAIARQEFPPGTVTKDRCVIVRLPISADLVVYLASVDYDPRDSLSLSRAETNARRQARYYLDALRTIPGCENAYLVSSGPEIGTRESRHLNCRHQLTWNEIEARKTFDDCIALGAWGAEWHDRETYASSFDYPPERSAYQIPLGCLHSIDTPNLFTAGRLADGDRKAGAAIRVMGTAMVTGQAAGIAAALMAQEAFSSDAVREQLRKGGALLDVAEEMV
jgi:FAD dependent oxidoreductase